MSVRSGRDGKGVLVGLECERNLTVTGDADSDSAACEGDSRS